MFLYVIIWDDYVIILQQVCSGMIDKVGEQLFAILDVANGTISAKDICGMVI